MEVALDVTAHNTPERPDEVVHLPGVRTSDSVGDSDTVNTYLVNSTVDAEEVDEVGPEGVLGREADFDALRLDELDDLDSRLDNIGNVLAVGVLAEEGGGADDDVNTVDACEREKQK